MKFTLSTTGYFYPEKHRRDKLSELGFKFKASDYKEFSIDESFYPTIELHNLTDLIEFTAKFGEIVLNGNDIEIYDDYRE